MKSSKEQYIKAHEKIEKGWRTGNWEYRDNMCSCQLCAIIHGVEGMFCPKKCKYCTQHYKNKICIHMDTYVAGAMKGTIRLRRAKYHRRAIEFLKTQPPERFHKKNIVKGWPELFEIDRQVAEGE